MWRQYAMLLGSSQDCIDKWNKTKKNTLKDMDMDIVLGDNSVSVWSGWE